MDFVRRPQIVNDQQQQEDVRGNRSMRGLVEEPTAREPRDRGDQYGYRRDVNDSLMSCRVATRAEGKEYQRREDHHVGDRGDVETIGVHSWRSRAANQAVSSSH